MCEQVPNYIEYRCGHPGTPTTSVIRRCSTARRQSDWETCGEVWEGPENGLNPPTEIPAPCKACKRNRSWVQHTDAQGRVRWRKTVGAIKPPPKE